MSPSPVSVQSTLDFLGLSPEPTGLDGSSSSSSGRIVPISPTTPFQKQTNEPGLAGLFFVVMFFFDLVDRFKALVDRFSYGATRQTLIGVGSVSVGGEPSLFSDLYLCSFCGRFTSDWITATTSDKKCVCRCCWPDHARQVYPAAQKVLPPDGGGVGGSGCTATGSRRYILSMVFLFLCLGASLFAQNWDGANWRNDDGSFFNGIAPDGLSYNENGDLKTGVFGWPQHGFVNGAPVSSGYSAVLGYWFDVGGVLLTGVGPEGFMAVNGILLDGVSSIDGRLYSSGVPVNGVNGRMYSDGYPVTGLASDGLLYSAGLLFSGFGFDGLMYADGAPLTGAFGPSDGTQYFQGLPLTGLAFDGLMYVQGLPLTGLASDGLMYADGLVFSGVGSDGQTYQDGFLQGAAPSLFDSLGVGSMSGDLARFVGFGVLAAAGIFLLLVGVSVSNRSFNNFIK